MDNQRLINIMIMICVTRMHVCTVVYVTWVTIVCMYHGLFHSRIMTFLPRAVQGLNDTPPLGSQHHGLQMAPPKTPQPEWEARLIMDKQSWPTKSASYTVISHTCGYKIIKSVSYTVISHTCLATKLSNLPRLR